MADGKTFGPFVGAAGVRKIKAWARERFLGKSDQAASAAKLGNAEAVGSASRPVYFTADGVPAAGAHELNEDVPAGAKFTDTTYAAATSAADGLMSKADKGRLDGMADGAQANVIEEVKVNGKALAASGKAVDVPVPVTVAELSDAGDYAKASALGAAASCGTESAVADDGNLPTGAAVKSFVETKGYQTASQVESAITDKGYQTASQVADKVESYGYQTASDVESAVSAALGSVYTVKGSVATYADLPTSGRKTGDVYNVVAADGDTPAGTNYVFDGGKWDALGGTFDTGGLVKDSELSEMSAEAIQAILDEE